MLLFPLGHGSPWRYIHVNFSSSLRIHHTQTWLFPVTPVAWSPALYFPYPFHLHSTNHRSRSCRSSTSDQPETLLPASRGLEVTYFIFNRQVTADFFRQMLLDFLKSYWMSLAWRYTTADKFFFGFKYWILDPAALHNQSFQRIWPSLVAFLHGNHFWNSVSRISIFRILTFRTMISEFKMSAVFR